MRNINAKTRQMHVVSACSPVDMTLLSQDCNFRERCKPLLDIYWIRAIKPI